MKSKALFLKSTNLFSHKGIAIIKLNTAKENVPFPHLLHIEYYFRVILQREKDSSLHCVSLRNDSSLWGMVEGSVVFNLLITL